MTSAIPSWAHIGKKVVCVREDWSSRCESTNFWMPNRPEFKKVYTIRDVGFSNNNFRIGILLDEIRNPIGDVAFLGGESAFHLEDFRPVQKRTIEQDVAIFKRLLNTKSIEELV